VCLFGHFCQRYVTLSGLTVTTLSDLPDAAVAKQSHEVRNLIWYFNMSADFDRNFPSEPQRQTFRLFQVPGDELSDIYVFTFRSHFLCRLK